ncbi:PREDICTED: uncharacterized protein LOC105361154, partial [Ceratosolen solmsi marchali]|uniref:Uncharacterized protein LOC105361154 n=1 Tax=Ceratosolen solmsi marchali TaxID=326594 RepID=A0AAJ7DU53_9HYME
MDGHKLEIPIIINVLQTLIDYKMPYIQKLIEIILKFIKNQLINLTPKDYQELTDINSKIQSNTLRQFVQKDLLQKFNLKISMDLDRNNLDFVISAFMNHKNDLEKLKLALEAVKNCNLQNASLNTILNLITAMSYVPHFPKNYCSILNKLQIYLIENIHQIKTNDILFLLHNMVFAADNNKNEEFYNEALFNKCAEVITSRDVTSSIAAACLNSFIRIRHMQKHLLDYTCSRYFIEKNNGVRFKEEFVLSSLINAYAQYNLKDVYLQKLIKNYEEIIKLIKSKKILDSALNFAVFEYYNASLLTNIFSNEEYYFNVAGRKFLNLWQKLKTTPNYNGPEPSEKCIKKFTIWHTKYNFELFPYLEKGLGGSIYIKKNLKTKLYHQIEYITMFRNGGYPIAINNIEDKNIEYIEDLQVPNNSKIVLIFEIPNYWYFQNSNIIIGKYSMYIDVIKSLSVEVIPINLNNWKTLTENEKIPYLMKEIHS